jgi:uncharacterized protein YjbJ (UPF0337 family)
MSTSDKVQHVGEKVSGQVKETTGRVTGNEDLEARGMAEKSKADMKQAGEKVADAAKDVFGKD